GAPKSAHPQAERSRDAPASGPGGGAPCASPPGEGRDPRGAPASAAGGRTPAEPAPAAGSLTQGPRRTRGAARTRMWRNWKTHRSQKPAATAVGFDSLPSASALGLGEQSVDG